MSSPWTEISCYRCDESFWVSNETYRVLKRSHQTFYCPFGHQQRFVEGKTEAQKLREQLEDERRRRQSAEQSIEYQRQQRVRAERSAVAYKGQATKLRKRVKAGVCPCCKRHFTELERHMHDQHPGFKTNPDADLPEGVAPVLPSPGAEVVELDVARKRPRQKAGG